MEIARSLSNERPMRTRVWKVTKLPLICRLESKNSRTFRQLLGNWPKKATKSAFFRYKNWQLFKRIRIFGNKSQIKAECVECALQNVGHGNWIGRSVIWPKLHRVWTFFFKKFDFNLWNNRHISQVVPLQFLHTKRNLHRLIYVNFERTANEWRTANHSHLDSRKVGNKFRRENVKATECFFLDPTQRLVSGRGQFWVNDETTGCAAAAAAGADLFFSLWLHLESPGIKIKWENKNGRKLCWP